MGAADDHLIGYTVRREWPLVQAGLDAGRPAALGLIRVRSRNPLRMGENHQVLAYGYELDEASGSLQIAIYDPNHGGRDDVALELNVSSPSDILSTTCEPFRGFFYTPYRR